MSRLLFPGLMAAALALSFDPARAREISGTGNGLLPVPGLRSVEAILIDGQELEPLVVNKFPTDNSDRPELVTQTWPLFDLTTTPDGTPAIVRNQQSNNGVWQEGAKITVIGDWEPEKPVKKSGGATAPATSIQDAGV